MVSFIRKITPSFLLSWYHMAMPFLGAVIYRFPSREIKVIGVTGTNGKTTTVNMISKILEGPGSKTAVMSSIDFKIAGEKKPNMLKMTMPGRFTIQKFLREAVNKNCQYAILEVSSEGIKQYRHLFINFDTAVFTNLSPEHIESHNGFENYKKAKGRLFQKTKNNHIINIDDENSDYFLNFSSDYKTCYGINSFIEGKKNLKFIKAENIKYDNKISFNIENINFELNLLGSFNIYNALAAISVGTFYGIDLEDCQKSLKEFKTVPGRMEEIISSPFRVIVDYAVTPDALEKLYQTLKETFSYGEMIAVLGSCGGGRDKWKRPILGEIASRYCDKIIITNEDPYDEDPMEIIESVASGVNQEKELYKIIDRREAINKAIKLASENDIVIITGKGCEPWMCVFGGKKIPWDDRKVSLEEYQKIIK